MKRTMLTTAVMVLTATITVAVSGCTFMTPQETKQIKQVVDGANANIGSVEVRNALALTSGNGTASLSMVVLNQGTKPRTVRFSYTTSSGWVSQSVHIGPDAMLLRGTRPGDEQMLLTHISARPGALLKVFVDDGETSGRMMQVPVLTGGLPDYSTLLPTPGGTNPADPGDTATPLD